MPVHAIFRAPVDQKNYRPVLTRIEITGDNSATFHIVFVVASAADQADVRDKSVARIFTALNLAHRFRWEIIDPYRSPERLQELLDRHDRICATTLGDAANALNGATGLQKLWDAIKLIETEAQSRGVRDPDVLPRDYGPASEQLVCDMFQIWNEKRRILEQAVQDDDVVSFANVLQELDPINREFISLTCHRLAELVDADANENG